MSTVNPSTDKLAEALGALVKEVQDIKATLTREQPHEWTETHAALIEKNLNAASDSSETVTVWKNTRKTPVTLTNIVITPTILGARSQFFEMRGLLFTVKAGDKYPIIDFPALFPTKAYVAVTFWGAIFPLTTDFPCRLRLKPDDEITFTAKYKTAAVNMVIMARCAATVTD